MKPLKPGMWIVVEWFDASDLHGWNDQDKMKQHNTMPVVTVGSVVEDGKDVILLTGSRAADGSGLGCLAIPRGWVHKIRRVRW